MRKAAPRLPASLLYRAIRQKDIKINGARCQPGDKLQAGDTVRVYLPDDVLSTDDSLLFLAAPPVVEVVYEDDHILLCNKPQGLLVHEDDSSTPDTLINRILHYLYQKGEWDPQKENSFTPALCNRIDRNTGGIVIAAKTFEALQIISEKIRLREIDKYYLCIVHGNPTHKSGTLKGYHVKDAANNTVTISTKPVPGAKIALTRYRVLEDWKDKSLLEVELLTGRTHQIRAQLAAIGHPLWGDAKYGTSRENARLGNRQALWAYKITFSFPTPAGPLEYLKGKTFSVPVPFVEEFRQHNGRTKQ